MNKQTDIAHDGGLLPLFDSKNDSLQSYSTFALYEIVANEDNISYFTKMSEFQTLQDEEFAVQAAKDRVTMTLHKN